MATDLSRLGITDGRVLDAVRAVRRAEFVRDELAEFAEEDAPLPIGLGETVPRPLVVALLAQAAEIGPDDRVLEVGTGSGYGAAVLARLGRDVISVERHVLLADDAVTRLRAAGVDGVRVLVGDGTAGVAEHAPFDAIVVTTPHVAASRGLRDQLADGGRLVLLTDVDERDVGLVRIRRDGAAFVEEDLGRVVTVAVGGGPADAEPDGAAMPEPAGGDRSIVLDPRSHRWVHGLPELIREVAEPMPSVAGAELGPLLDRIGDAPVVLLGEATHGTSEFYRLRSRITRALVERKGFTTIAIEGDWPDAARVDRYVRDRMRPGPDFEVFSRFPTWMWRNAEVAELVGWLRDHNRMVDDPAREVGFCGLDLYSLYTSRDEVLSYLRRIDPEAEAVARRRYECLTPWQRDPAAYGHAVVTGRFAGCEEGVVATLSDLLKRRLEYEADTGDAYLDAAQNAVVVANAERYYRAMYSGSRVSWNLRDQHMFETLQTIRAARGPGAKVVVWEHNSHVGDASATEMGARGEHNVGMLCRRHFGDDAYLVGFGTDHGTVAAASDWGGPMQVKSVRPSHSRSYERVFHDSGVEAFMLHLREPRRPEVRTELAPPRLERAIGVIYRPETELQSHYFEASLPSQFDEYVWIDETRAVHAAPSRPTDGAADTYPFGV